MSLLLASPSTPKKTSKTAKLFAHNRAKEHGICLGLRCATKCFENADLPTCPNCPVCNKEVSPTS